MTSTKDLYRIKNELQLAIIKTFENKGIDSFAGSIILQAILSEIKEPEYSRSCYIEDKNETPESQKE